MALSNRLFDFIFTIRCL